MYIIFWPRAWILKFLGSKLFRCPKSAVLPLQRNLLWLLQTLSYNLPDDVTRKHWAQSSRRTSWNFQGSLVTTKLPPSVHLMFFWTFWMLTPSQLRRSFVMKVKNFFFFLKGIQASSLVRRLFTSSNSSAVSIRAGTLLSSSLHISRPWENGPLLEERENCVCEWRWPTATEKKNRKSERFVALYHEEFFFAWGYNTCIHFFISLLV